LLLVFAFLSSLFSHLALSSKASMCASKTFRVVGFASSRVQTRVPSSRTT
jgi:hypothetical protein